METDYKHQIDGSKVAGRAGLKSSPYMIVRNVNDTLKVDGAMGDLKFRDGRVQDSVEQATLEACMLPGVNGRLGMPAKATLRPAVREADEARIVQFSALPAAQTKRCLVLRALEGLMKETMKEREFNFLDRNYVEEFKDSHVMRQVLSEAFLLSKADVATKYYGMGDGLLVSLFYKNPPGRLLRRQWSAVPRVMPNFSEWLNEVQDPAALGQLQSWLDINQSNVGLLKENIKFSFPSDNSIIRVVKHQAGGKRMGDSQIVKDNFVFGLCERRDVYDSKADGEDGLRNRDANKHADRRCNLWLLFENGVRLNIEMQDAREADTTALPPAAVPEWLKMDPVKAVPSQAIVSVDQEDVDVPIDEVARSNQSATKQESKDKMSGGARSP